MKAIACIICSILLTISAKAWTPPIGIPAPNWGPTIGNPIETAAPKPPANWTSNIPNIYYVQAGGTNQNEGFPGNPRESIPPILPAGSVVFVNGTYTTDHSIYYIRHAGTATAPCWILSYDPTKPAIATKGWSLVATSYLIIDNINWDWSQSSSGGCIELAGGVDHVCFRNGSTKGKGISDPLDPNFTDATYAHNGTTFVVQSSGSLTVDPSEQLVIANMKITKAGNWMYDGAQNDPDAHGISVGFPTKDMWFVDNEFSYLSGDAIQVGSGSIDSTPDENVSQRMYIGRNIAHHIAQSAFWSKRSVDCIMSQNTAYTMRRDCPSSPNSGGFGGQYGPKNLWIIYNTVYNCQGGIAIAGGADAPATNTDIYIIGNVFYDIHDKQGAIDDWRGNSNSGGGVAILLRGGLDHYIVNNMIDNYDAGILSPIIGHNRYVEGNIFTNRNGAVEGMDVNFDGGDAGGLNTFKSNIIQEVSGGCYIKTGDKTYTTVAALNGAKGPGNSNGAPTYVNASLGNYALAEGSNGVDGFGTTANKVYDLFQSKYGRSIKVDRSGGARPFNSAWDIGAYEFGAVGAPEPPPVIESPPSQPTGLKIKPN